MKFACTRFGDSPNLDSGEAILSALTTVPSVEQLKSEQEKEKRNSLVKSDPVVSNFKRPRLQQAIVSE